VQTVFAIVIFSVVAVSGLIAVATFFVGGAPYDRIGSGGMAPPPREPEEETPAMREDDVRQMLEARSRRRVARGAAGGDVDAELAELLSPSEERRGPVPADLREEAESIVRARQTRRRRRGRPEGDFEAEVEALLKTIGA
jgi:hypothetical protein